MDRREFIRNMAIAAAAVGVVPLAFAGEAIGDAYLEAFTSEVLEVGEWTVRIAPEYAYAKQVIFEKDRYRHSWIIEQQDNGPMPDDECIAKCKEMYTKGGKWLGAEK